MDDALVVTALLMGLAGGPHCAAMCGAACSAFAGRDGPLSQRMLALHAGRIAGYAAGGALVATSVSTLAAFAPAAPMLRPLWGMVHVAAIALGFWLLRAGRAPEWLSLPSPRLARLAASQPVRIFRTLPAPARAGLVGACWTAMPCGLLQSALLVAALASGARQGAAVMASFALASTLGLWLAQGLWSGLRKADDGRRFAALSVRCAGVLLVASSGFALWHGLGAALCGLA
jgi:hypothetical protein